jgi:hypothetical protein
VRIGHKQHSTLPLPFDASGDIEIQLQFTSGASLNISAKKVIVSFRSLG